MYLECSRRLRKESVRVARDECFRRRGKESETFRRIPARDIDERLAKMYGARTIETCSSLAHGRVRIVGARQ